MNARGKAGIPPCMHCCDPRVCRARAPAHLGTLVGHGRYAFDEEKDTFAGLTPAVFVTTAAPHLGARQTQYGPLAPLLRLLPSFVSICVEIKFRTPHVVPVAATARWLA